MKIHLVRNVIVPAEIRICVVLANLPGITVLADMGGPGLRIHVHCAPDIWFSIIISENIVGKYMRMGKYMKWENM